MPTTVRYETDGPVAYLTLDRPHVKNAVGPEEWHGLADGVAKAGAATDIRVIVVSGSGGTFSAGGDLKTMPERLALPREERRRTLLADMQVIQAFRSTPKPIVARIDGAAVGAGLSLALACDIRIAASDARLGATFHRIGLTGDFGMLWLLPRAVGPTRAMDLLMSSSLISGTRAEEIGLVTRAVPREELALATASYVERLVQGPPIAMAFTKQGLNLAHERDLASLLELEADAQATCSKTEDVHEGIRAFHEKRPPQFRGR